MTFLDFFAGIGGFRSGFEKAGHKCVGFCEWDKYARQSYKAMYNIEGEWENHDVTTVNSSDVPKADIWCFGFPCQDISVAGKQKGLQAGERSGLFYEIIRLLAGLKEEDKPEWLVAENVKNLLSIGNGFDFARVLFELGGVGYDVEWQLFNTKYSYIVDQTYIAGIPQNRERVYIVGHLRSRGGREVLPICRADEEDNSELKQVGKECNHRNNPNRHRVYDESGIAPTLNCMGGGGLQPCIVDDTNMGFDHGGLRIHEDCPTLRSERSGLKVAIPVLTPDREEKRQNGRRFKEDGEEMFTLTAQDRHGVAVYDTYNKKMRTDGNCGTLTTNTNVTGCGVFMVIENEKTDTNDIEIPSCGETKETYQEIRKSNVLQRQNLRIRRLSPRETWCLQGFTDEQFDKAAAAGVSDTQLYKQAGNAVSVNITYAIGLALKNTEKETKENHENS